MSTRQEWLQQAEDYQRRMDEIDDPDDPIYQMCEAVRDACYANSADALEQEPT